MYSLAVPAYAFPHCHLIMPCTQVDLEYSRTRRQKVMRVTITIIFSTALILHTIGIFYVINRIPIIFITVITILFLLLFLVMVEFLFFLIKFPLTPLFPNTFLFVFSCAKSELFSYSINIDNISLS